MSIMLDDFLGNVVHMNEHISIRDYYTQKEIFNGSCSELDRYYYNEYASIADSVIDLVTTNGRELVIYIRAKKRNVMPIN